MKWRPIKSAPKDQLILLAQPPHNHYDYRPGDPNRGWFVAMGRWIDVPHTNEILALIRRQMGQEDTFLSKDITTFEQLADAARETAHWSVIYDGISEGFVCGSSESHLSHGPSPNIVYPTHWAPLPAPPKGRYKRPY